ncbi:MAG: hypothetical protein U0574_06090 [Phycisphaerales bacterium]
MHHHHTRWLAITLPYWSTDLARRRLGPPPGTPLLAVTTRGEQRLVAAACASAAQAGVHPGMTLAHARALCGPQAMDVPWNPQADGRALRRLARWCMRYAPGVAVVEAEGPAAVVVDVTGSQRLHRGDAALAARVVRDLHLKAVTAHVAVAGTRAAALAASAVWPCRVLPSAPDGGQEEAVAALSALPIQVLRLPAEVVEALREVNVTQIGHALALPRTGSADRVGPALWAALDALRGLAPEPFEAMRPVEPVEVERLFDGATTRLESVMAAVEWTLDRFVDGLKRRERGVRHLELQLLRIDALPVVERLHLGRATARRGHLWSLLRPRVEGAHLGHGVEGVRMRSLADAALRHGQRQWDAGGRVHDGHDWESREGERSRSLGELLDRLAARLGHQAVERLPVPPQRSAAVERQLSAAMADGGSAWFASWLRPTLLFGTPLPARVTTEVDPLGHGAPAEVRWAGGGGRVRQRVGPERRPAPWWNGSPGAAGGERSAWRVQTDDGRWLWLRRNVDPADADERGDARWWVDGVWA